MTKPTQQDIKFLHKYANKVQTPTGEVYYYIPYWFRTSNGVHERLSFETLPQDFKTYLIKSREEIRNKK
jgi:hypothetical protein